MAISTEKKLEHFIYMHDFKPLILIDISNKLKENIIKYLNLDICQILSFINQEIFHSTATEKLKYLVPDFRFVDRNSVSDENRDGGDDMDNIILRFSSINNKALEQKLDSYQKPLCKKNKIN